MGKKNKNEPKMAFHVVINGLRGREWAKVDFKKVLKREIKS